jgi:uncharacterized membrane protein
VPKPRSRPRHEGSPRRAVPARPGQTEAPRAAPSRRALLTLVVLMGGYALVYGVITSVKFRFYLYSDFDLAIFAQATDQALRGTLFSSIRGMNWLGDHVSLILFAIAPLYAVLRHPMTLLLLQCLALALGALPVFALARRELGHDGIALSFAALYLLHPAVGYTNLFEFHPEVLATGGLLATFWAISAGRLGLTILFAGLSLACREDVAMVVMMLGLVALLPGRPRRFAFALLALGAISLVLSFVVIRPAFSSTAVEYGQMYKTWGATLGEVALNVLKDPLRAVGAFFSTPGDPGDTAFKRLYWPHMLGPLLFLPLLSPVTLAVALPVLAEHFLSSRPQQHWMHYQYTALVTPVLVVAAVRGLGNLVRWVARGRSAAAAIAQSGGARWVAVAAAGAALVASLVCNLLYGPLLRQGWVPVPPLPQRNWPSAHDRMRRVVRDRMVVRAPREGGVVAGFEFLARLASRRNVHSLHHLYVGFYTFSTRSYPMPGGIGALIADFGDARLAPYAKPGTPGRLRELVATNDLHPVDAAGDMVLFLRARTDTVELFRAGIPESGIVSFPRKVTWDRQLALAGFSLPESTVAAGSPLKVETFWRRVAPADRQFMIQFLLRDEEGRTVFSVVRHLGYLLYPIREWPADSAVRETYRLVIPPHLRPGAYTLGLRVAWWRNGPPALSQPDDPQLAGQNLALPLGRFTVLPSPGR